MGALFLAAVITSYIRALAIYSIQPTIRAIAPITQPVGIDIEHSASLTTMHHESKSPGMDVPGPSR